jgi:hypothetical protein
MATATSNDRSFSVSSVTSVFKKKAAGHAPFPVGPFINHMMKLMDGAVRLRLPRTYR